MSQYDYDLFVIGAGSGGVRAARMATRYGVKVGIAEERYYGGTCVNVGCVPKKLFVYGSHYSEHMEDSRAYGWNIQTSEFNWPTLRDNKTKEIERLNGIYRRLLTDAGVDQYDAKATFIDAHTLMVGEKTVSAKKILVATGSWPTVPDFPGKEHCITSNEAFYLEQFPARVLVVGGGYIAVEFAGIFAGLGAKTIVSYRQNVPLRGFDEGVRHFVLDEMRKKGIEFKLSSTVASVTKTTQGLVVTMADGAELVTDCVLFATGRRPLVEDLGLEKVGVDTAPEGTIKVDQYFQTNIPSIYALGDVIGTPQLTPVAITQAMALVQTLFNDNPTTVDYTNIATAVFCQPTIGTVGLTELEAKAQFGEVDVYQSTFRPMKHTLTGRDEKTLMKLIVDVKSDKVVGAHIVGDDAGEMIQCLAVAMKAGATKTDFDTTIGIHPTAAEELVTMRDISVSHRS